MKDELRPKTNCCLADDNDKNKKAKVMKKCVIKQKLKLEDNKRFLEATQLENEENHHEKIKLVVESLRENYKIFIKKKKKTTIKITAKI